MKISIIVLLTLVFLSCGESKQRLQTEGSKSSTDSIKTIDSEELQVSGSLNEVANTLTTSFNLEIDTSELETIHVGPSQMVKTVSQVFQTERNNIHVIIDEGVYVNEEELYVSGYNIIIEGNGLVELQCKKLYNNVMWVSGKGIIIRNLHLTHFKPGTIEHQNCSGRVIGLEGASEVLIENCDINGCGLVGVHDNLNNSRVHIKNNYIHYNSLAPFGNIDGDLWMEEIVDHAVFSFENNRIENNGPGRIAEYQDTLDFSNFSEEQALEIGKITNVWNDSFRHQIYEDHDVKHNCSDCESTSLLLELSINSEGRIEKVAVLKNRIFCLNEKGKEALKIDMVNSIQAEWNFSKLFAFKIVQVRVGLILKC